MTKEQRKSYHKKWRETHKDKWNAYMRKYYANRTAKKIASERSEIESRVAREIFEEIEKSFIEYYEKTITYSSPTLPLYIREAAGFSLNEMFMKIAELKKKYTKENEQ